MGACAKGPLIGSQLVPQLQWPQRHFLNLRALCIVSCNCLGFERKLEEQKRVGLSCSLPFFLFLSLRSQEQFQRNPESYNGAVRENYSWSQDYTDLELKVPVPAHVRKGKQVSVGKGRSKKGCAHSSSGSVTASEALPTSLHPDLVLSLHLHGFLLVGFSLGPHPAVLRTVRPSRENGMFMEIVAESVVIIGHGD